MAQSWGFLLPTHQRGGGGAEGNWSHILAQWYSDEFSRELGVGEWSSESVWPGTGFFTTAITSFWKESLDLLTHAISSAHRCH